MKIQLVILLLLFSCVISSQSDMLWFVDPGTAISFDDGDLNITKGNPYYDGGCRITSIAYADDKCGLRYFSKEAALYDGRFNKVPSPDRLIYAPTASQTLSTIRFDEFHYIFSTPRRTEAGDGGIWVSKIILDDNCGVDTVFYNIEKIEGDFSFVVSTEFGCCEKFITAYDHSDLSIKVYPVTEEGIGQPISSYVGLQSDLRYFDGQRGGIYFSPNLDKMVISLTRNNPLHLYDFNKSDKKVEFRDSIQYEERFKIAYSAAFSNNGKMLYVLENGPVSGDRKLLQYDLSLPLNDMNRFLIAQLEDDDNFAELIGTNLDKIYLSANGPKIGVITKPNERGATTDFLFDVNEDGLTPRLLFTIFGCSLNPSIVRQGPREFLFKTRDTTICEGLFSYIDDGCFTDYKWVNRDITGPDITIEESGEYILSASINACEVFDTIMITVLSAIESFIDEEICQGDTLVLGVRKYFTAGMYSDTLLTVQGCDSIVNLDLFISDIILGDTSSVLITTDEIYTYLGVDYAMPGIYEVVASSASGCDSITYLEVRLDQVSLVNDGLYIANVFSPNSDGLNDELQVQIPTNIDLLITEFSIYDRYGILQHQEVGPVSNLSWNGNTQTNSSLGPGVYIYKVIFESQDGNQFTRIGDVTLLK